MNEFNNDEHWLNNLLAQSPKIKEGAFAFAVTDRIQREKRKRYSILGVAWLLASAVTVVSLPWQTLWFTIQRLFSTTLQSEPLPHFTGTANTVWHWSDVVAWASQSSVAPVIVVALLAVICVLQWLLQEN